jgi:hypothetical protein
MMSPVSFLTLGNGKMTQSMGWLHHGGISCDHMVSPKGLSNGTQGHVTRNIQTQNSDLL